MNDTGIIEIAARAGYDAYCSVSPSPNPPWDQLPPFGQAMARHQAAAIVQALYEAEPTDAMMAAVLPLSNRVGRIHVRTAWRAMLDAALKETNDVIR